MDSQNTAAHQPSNRQVTSIVVALLALLALFVHVSTSRFAAEYFLFLTRRSLILPLSMAPPRVGEGLSPYGWTPENTALLAGRISGSARSNSTPMWLVLLWPLSHVPFELAATLWTGLLILISAYCSRRLSKIAGYSSWTALAIAFLVTITFGPVVLTLTLGQNSGFLLLAVLIAGQNHPALTQVRICYRRQLERGHCSETLPVLWLFAFFCAGGVLMIAFVSLALLSVFDIYRASEQQR